MATSKLYSVHSSTEYQDCDTLEEAQSIAESMCIELGRSYIVNNQTEEVIQVY